MWDMGGQNLLSQHFFSVACQARHKDSQLNAKSDSFNATLTCYFAALPAPIVLSRDSASG